jgi:hypothetical protein
MIYKILRLNTDCWTSFLIALAVGFSINVVFTAIFPWTEQLHLFFLLSAIYIYLRYKGTAFWVGMIFAISCFVRIAGFYNIFAFGLALVVLKGFSRSAVKEYVKVASGFLITFLSFEAFCFFRYGVFYPEFFAMGKIWRRAEIMPGAFYNAGTPILSFPPVEIGIDVIFANLKKHVINFVKVFGNMEFVFILAPIYAAFNLLRRKNSLSVILFLQGACTLLGLLLVHTAWPESEYTRLSLIPFITLTIVGFLCLKWSINYLLSEVSGKGLSVVFFIIILFFISLQIKTYLPFRNYYKNIYPQQAKVYRESRDEIYKWIKTNTAEDDLIASNFLADPFLHGRPFISLPPGRAMNAKNMKDFLKIFKPEYILTNNQNLINFLKGIGFVEKKKSGFLVLLGGV